MATAVVLGGNGLVGAAAARVLLGAGWEVTCTGLSNNRFPPDLRERGGRFVRSNRYDPEDLRRVLHSGADIVVDCVGYTAAHSRLLLGHINSIGSVVFISSKAVYVDEHGRHSNSAEPPAFPRPVSEDQPTMEPAALGYASAEDYGANKVAAERVLLDSGVTVSVLRPSRIHGVGAARPREWVFVRRVLDGRQRILLARHGRGVNHPTAAVNLAALVQLCAAIPGTRILNSADPDAPDGLAISRVISTHLAHAWDETLLDDTAPTDLGDHPWNTLPPFVLDTTAASRLGYVPVGSYADTVRAEVDWLVDAARAGDPNGVLPATDDPYFARFFDYRREDTFRLFEANDVQAADARYPRAAFPDGRG